MSVHSSKAMLPEAPLPKKGSNTPLPPNWSIFLTGEPLINTITKFSKTPSQAIAADPAIAAIFTDAMASNQSVAWALSSLITILSMTSYYSQQPAMDREYSVSASFFTAVLYPQSFTGLTIVLWTLVAHFLLMAALVVLFVKRTKLTLLGNVWAAFAQMSESQELRALVSEASLMTDREVEKQWKGMSKVGLRARVVKRSDGAEVTVE